MPHDDDQSAGSSGDAKRFVLLMVLPAVAMFVIGIFV